VGLRSANPSAAAEAASIAKPDERQPVLRLDRPRREDAKPTLTGQLHACPPKRRLPDTGLAVHDERTRLIRIEECLDRGEIAPPPHEVDHEPPEIVIREDPERNRSAGIRGSRRHRSRLGYDSATGAKPQWRAALRGSLHNKTDDCLGQNAVVRHRICRLLRQHDQHDEHADGDYRSTSLETPAYRGFLFSPSG
jgi:hypothetical protein